jgi:hypothetical protein
MAGAGYVSPVDLHINVVSILFGIGCPSGSFWAASTFNSACPVYCFH